MCFFSSDVDYVVFFFDKMVCFFQRCSSVRANVLLYKTIMFFVSGWDYLCPVFGMKGVMVIC